MNIWEMPADQDEMYENVNAIYRVREYSNEWDMDNNQSMNWFCEYMNFDEDQYLEQNGTQVIVKIKDKIFLIDSHGFGDFYSHQFDVEELTGYEQPTL